MAHKADIKTALRTTYIQGDDLKGAAAKHNVSYETARNWKRTSKEAGDDWETSKAAYRLSNSDVERLTTSIIERFVLLFEATIIALDENKEIDPLKKADAIAKLADSYQKTVNAAKSSSKQLSALAVAMDCMKRLASFIDSKYPQHKEAFADILQPFGKELTRHYG